MSDDESIEEEIEYEEESGSQGYFDDEDFLPRQPSPKPSLILSKPLKTDDNRPAPLPAAANRQLSNLTPVQQQSFASAADDYSMDFSNDYANETYYSEKFEDEASASAVKASTVTFSLPAPAPATGAAGAGSLPPQPPATSASVSASASAPSNTNTLTLTSAASAAATLQAVPAMSVQALQAEAAVEELSREVVRLRNQHRNINHQRRVALEAKKKRAEERRAKYRDDMKAMESRLLEADNSVAVLKQQLTAAGRESDGLREQLEQQHKAAEKERGAQLERQEQLQSTIERLEKNIDDLQGDSRALQEQLDRAADDKRGVISAWEGRKEAWGEERAGLLLEIEKLKLSNGIVNRAVEAAEARINKERELLPAHHANRVAEEVARLKELQEAARELEVRSRLDEERRKVAYDALRSELLGEVARSRSEMQINIDEQRRSLARQQGELEAARTRQEAQQSAEKAELQSLRVQLAQQQQEVEEARWRVQQEKNELETATRMVGPNLRTVQQDKEAALEARRQAERVLSNVTEQATELLAVEKKLLERERALNEVTQENHLSLELVTAKNHGLRSREDTLVARAKKLDTERFTLHQCSMEIHRQMEVLRNALRVVLRMQPPSSMPDGSGGADIDEADADQENQNPRQHQRRQPCSSSGGELRGAAVDYNAYKVLNSLDQAGRLLQDMSLNLAPTASEESWRDSSTGSGTGCGAAEAVLSTMARLPEKSTNLMATYQQCANISKQLFEMSKKDVRVSSGGSGGSEGAQLLLTSYQQNYGDRHESAALRSHTMGSVQISQEERSKDDITSGSGSNLLCIGNVMDDVHSSTAMLQSIAAKYT